MGACRLLPLKDHDLSSDISPSPRAEDMSEEEKLDFGAARKEVGGGLFKSGRYHLAMERYKKEPVSGTPRATPKTPHEPGQSPI